MNIPPSISRTASRLALTASLFVGQGCDTSDVPQGCMTTQNTAPLQAVSSNIHTKAKAALDAMTTLLKAEKAQSIQADVTFNWGTHINNLPVVQMGSSFIECHTQDHDTTIVCGIGTLSNSKATNGYNATDYTEVNVDTDSVILYPPDSGNALTIQQSQDLCQASDGTHWGTPCENDTQVCTDTIVDIGKQTHQVYDMFTQKIGKQP